MEMIQNANQPITE